MDGFIIELCFALSLAGTVPPGDVELEIIFGDNYLYTSSRSQEDKESTQKLLCRDYYIEDLEPETTT